MSGSISNSAGEHWFAVFCLGAILGLVAGVGLSVWLGEEELTRLLRNVRRIGGDDSNPHFDMLAQ